MKQATQLAFYGTSAMAVSTIISFFFNQYFGFGGETIYYITQIIDLLGMISIANFFYKLNQKQSQKIKNNDSNEFKE
jgi:hypothetical protein